jgi:hypothetical protein
LILIEGIDSSHEAVKRTGKALLIASGAFGTLLFLSHSHIDGWGHWNWRQGFEANGWKWFFGFGLVFFVASHLAYPAMKPIHFWWMKFAFALGWINTRLLLGVFFYFVLTPIGLMMKLFGKDLLDRKFEPNAVSYWKKRTRPFDPRTMERQF